MDCARASTGVKSRMNNVAAALLHLLQLRRPRLLIIIAVALPGEITFTRGKIGFAEAFNSIVATDNHCSREAQSFFGTRLIIPPNIKRTKDAAGQTAKKAGFTFSYLSQRIGQARAVRDYRAYQSRFGFSAQIKDRREGGLR